jgi:tRNA pseudouridine synthase 10
MGNGRPFFAKLLSPKKRNVRLAKKSNLNEIMIYDLRKIDHIPNGSIQFRSKTKMLVSTKNNLSSNKLKKLKQLTDAPIEITDSNKQYKKRIYKLKYKKHSLQSFAVEMEADGGIPIKRLVNGFSVVPNISSILNTYCSCEKFDVDQIYLSK